MPFHMNRRTLLAFFAAICILAAAADARAAGGAWAKVDYDPGVPAETRDNVAASLDTVAALLSEYRIYLTRPVTIVVSADHEGYVNALMNYGYSRENAENKARHTAGVSLNQRPVILIKGSDRLKQDREEVYRVLPHELFHQVQRQWGRLGTVNWMVEAAPELFRIQAAAKAGFAPAAVQLAGERLRIKHAQAIPGAGELASQNYAAFSDLAARGYPVYPMSTLMLSKLTEDAGFDKVVSFYQQLHRGADPDQAFLATFRVPMGRFVAEMDKYFAALRQ